MSTPYARYLEPRKGPSEAAIRAMTPERQRFPTNPDFAGVHARYLEPRAVRPEPLPPGIDECTFDVRKHREASNARYSGLQPRYMAIKPTDPEQSPRRLVEKRLDEQKRERALWRGDTVSGKYATFDDLMRQTRKAEENVPKPRPVTAPSRVAQYLLHGTASQPYATNSPRRQTPKRDGSPMRSPRHWHSAGVDSTTFDRRQKETSSQPWFQRQEKRVQALAERRGSIRVAPDHVPRVASLAIAEQIKLADRSALSAPNETSYAIDGDETQEVQPPPSATPVLRFR